MIALQTAKAWTSSQASLRSYESLCLFRDEMQCFSNISINVARPTTISLNRISPTWHREQRAVHGERGAAGCPGGGVEPHGSVAI